MNDSSITSRCEKDIEQRILNGEFLPGARLHNNELAKHYGVAISPIREALSRLISSGLVDFVDKKGFFVSQINRQDFIDIAETYADIECLALQKAIEKGDETWESNIAGTCYQLAKVENGKPIPYAQWAEKNRAFHRALIEGCGSSHLLQCRDFMYQQHERYIRLSYQFSSSQDLIVNHQEHQTLADLVLARKTKEAVKALRSHILDGQSSLLERLQTSQLLNQN